MADTLDLGPTGRTVARNLAYWRGRRGMTLAELARRLEVAGAPIPEVGLSRIEGLKRRVSVDDLVALVVVLEIAIADLLVPLPAVEPPEATALDHSPTREHIAVGLGLDPYALDIARDYPRTSNTFDDSGRTLDGLGRWRRDTYRHLDKTQALERRVEELHASLRELRRLVMIDIGDHKTNGNDGNDGNDGKR